MMPTTRVGGSRFGTGCRSCSSNNKQQLIRKIESFVQHNGASSSSAIDLVRGSEWVDVPTIAIKKILTGNLQLNTNKIKDKSKKYENEKAFIISLPYLETLY